MRLSFLCSCIALLLALVALVPAPASADLLSDLLTGGLGGGGGGGGRGGARNNQPSQRGGGGGGRGGSSGGADTCSSFVCPLPHHAPLARPNWVPQSNGCGSYGFRINSAWHEGCCDVHDKCYSTCGRRRESCDGEFQSCMAAQCSRQRDPKARSDCEGQANLFFIATTSLGCSTFMDSQREACQCTPLQKAKGAVKDAAAAVAAGVQSIKQQVQDEL